MDNPERDLQARLSTALQRVAVLEHAVESQDLPKGGDRLLADLRRLARDLERTLVESRDAALGRDRLRRVAAASTRRATLLFDLSPTASLLIDRVGTIVDANPAAVQLLNTSLRHLAGRALPVFVSADREQFLLRLAMIGDGDRPARWPITIRPRERACRRLTFTAVAETHDQLLVLLQPTEGEPAEAAQEMIAAVPPADHPHASGPAS